MWSWQMESKQKERPHINLPNGKKMSFSYISRVANGEKPITLEKLEKTHLWSTLPREEKDRIRNEYFK